MVGRADTDHISTQISDGEKDMEPYTSLWYGGLFRAEETEF